MDRHLVIIGVYCAISFMIAGSLHALVFYWKRQQIVEKKYVEIGQFSLHSIKKKSLFFRWKTYFPSMYTFEIAAYVFTWYGVSLSLTMFNKWFLVYFNGGFPFPITASAVHMFLKLVMSRIVMRYAGISVPVVTTELYWRAIVPIGVSTALDVGMSNLAFRFVSVTFYTILKSGSLMWLLLWAVWMKVEVFTFKMSIIILVITVGLALASFGQTNFSWVGFLLVTGSCCCSGLRWVMTQRVVSINKDYASPLLIIYLIAPSSAVGLLPFAGAMESWRFSSEPFFTNCTLPVALETTTMLLFGAVISFLLVFAEVKLVELTTALTMGVFGQIKEILTITLSMAIFGDHLSAFNVYGLVLAMLGTAWYKKEKLSQQSPENSQSTCEEGAVEDNLWLLGTQTQSHGKHATK